MYVRKVREGLLNIVNDEIKRNAPSKDFEIVLIKLEEETDTEVYEEEIEEEPPCCNKQNKVYEPSERLKLAKEKSSTKVIYLQSLCENKEQEEKPSRRDSKETNYATDIESDMSFLDL